MMGPRFLMACARLAVDATPVWLMRQAGRYLPEYRRVRARRGLLEICAEPSLAADVTVQPLRRFDLDAAILFSDILLPLRAMGVRLRYASGEGPVLDPPVRDLAGAARLRELRPEEDLPAVLETIRLARQELAAMAKPGEAPVPLIGFAGAPFTLASYLIEGGPSTGYLRTRALMYGEPQAWRSLMSKLSRAMGRYLASQAGAGAQALQVFDSWAGALSPAEYRRFVKPYSARMISIARKAAVPVIHFGTGTAGFLKDFSEAGGDVVGVDWRVALDHAWGQIGHKKAIQGNLSPHVLALAPRAELKAAARTILKECRGQRGHIFNLGHGVLPQTPIDNVRALVDQVHEG